MNYEGRRSLRGEKGRRYRRKKRRSGVRVMEILAISVQTDCLSSMMRVMIVRHVWSSHALLQSAKPERVKKEERRTAGRRTNQQRARSCSSSSKRACALFRQQVAIYCKVLLQQRTVSVRRRAAGGHTSRCASHINIQECRLSCHEEVRQLLTGKPSRALLLADLSTVVSSSGVSCWRSV